MSILSVKSFSQFKIINEFKRSELIVERKLCLINFNLLKVRSLDAVITGAVNVRRHNQFAQGKSFCNSVDF